MQFVMLDKTFGKLWNTKEHFLKENFTIINTKTLKRFYSLNKTIVFILFFF